MGCESLSQCTIQLTGLVGVEWGFCNSASEHNGLYYCPYNVVIEGVESLGEALWD